MRVVVNPTRPIPAHIVPQLLAEALIRCGACEVTSRRYQGHATHFVEALQTLAPRIAADIRKLDVNTILAYLSQDTVSQSGNVRAATTRAVRVNAVRCLVRGLNAAHALPGCVPEDLPAPRLPSPAPPRIVPANKCAALLRALRGSETPAELMTWVLGILVLVTGLRVSEVHALDVSGLDLHNGQAVVRRKGGAVKTVVLSPELAAMLDWYIERIRPQLAGARREPDALFVTRVGRISVNEVDRRFACAGAAIGLPAAQRQPHRLRATAITLVAHSQGPFAAQDFAAHKNLPTTLRYISVAGVSSKTVAATHGSQVAALIKLPTFPAPVSGTARSARSGAAGLPLRQRQVFELIGQRRSAREIATVLGIAHATVRRHMDELYKQLGGGASCRALAEAEVAASAPGA